MHSEHVNGYQYSFRKNGALMLMLIPPNNNNDNLSPSTASTFCGQQRLVVWALAHPNVIHAYAYLNSSCKRAQCTPNIDYLTIVLSKKESWTRLAGDSNARAQQASKPQHAIESLLYLRYCTCPLEALNRFVSTLYLLSTLLPFQHLCISCWLAGSTAESFYATYIRR